MYTWPAYPPCKITLCGGGTCTTCSDRQCCAQGAKFRWPELKGKSGEEAKATIERENPNVTVVVLPWGMGSTDDFCCNRINVFLDPHGNVFNLPQIG